MALRDKVVILTGASMGIGRAMATILAQQGCRVVCAARSQDKIEQLAAEINAAGGQSLAVRTDVSDRQSVRQMVAATMQAFGRVDILINNAGGPLAGAARPLSSADEFFELMETLTCAAITDEDWERIFAINFYGAVYASRAVLPIMQAQQSGHIVNITSKAGKTHTDVVPGMIAYASAKAALSRFTEVLAFELMCEGSPVRVNAISPGNVAVTLHANLPPDELEGYRRPEDIREALLFVLESDTVVSGEIYGAETMQTWIDEIRAGA